MDKALDAGALTFSYRNWRGEVSVRNVRPVGISFGATEWHPEPQWLLHAFDLDKQAERDFAIKDIGAALPATDTSGLVERLRARKIDGDLDRDTGFGRVRIPDPDCHAAADRIEALERKSDQRLQEALGWKGMYVVAAKDRDRQLTRAEKAEARLAEADAVIRPFVDIANAVFRVDCGREMNATRKDDHPVWGFDRTELTFGHLRAARSYLEGRK